ncbi:unnamed protein product [Leptidea sinapis]|uniref:Uncharacterized protein n=1 Tax=Leptidea sinapis TaxID=189913 RepID=A0A5E4QP06_9NEOP|nr:unnamed protein product [Leptidea sinapis]
MKRIDSQCIMKEHSRSSRLLTESVSSEEHETEHLLCHKAPTIVPEAGGRRGSLTAPASPTDFRKKRDIPRHHNYINSLHHLIHWRDIWSGEPQRPQEFTVALRSAFSVAR